MVKNSSGRIKKQFLTNMSTDFGDKHLEARLSAENQTTASAAQRRSGAKAAGKSHTPPHPVSGIRHPASGSLLLILAAFVALALAFNLIIPPYENLDENEHAEVVRYIAVNGRLPIHGQAEAEGFRTRQEASQPPLYHILAAGWSWLWRLPTEPHPHELAPAAVVTCGPGDTLYNRATWVHNPYAERLWRGPTLTLHAVRVFSTLLQTLTIVGVWTLARRAFNTRTATLATCLVAFNPQFLLLASGVNNDNAVIPLATWGLVLAFDIGTHGPTLKRIALLGLLSGLAGLSKLSGLALFGLGGLAMLIRTLKREQSFRTLVGWSVLLIAITGLLVAPWMLRNQRLYGDPTALAPMLEKVGHRDYPMDWNEAKLMMLSFWGQLPCAFYPRALYWPYLFLMAGGSLGLALGWRRFRPQQRLALTLSLVWFGIITAAWVRWNLTTPATGGRLLFPAIAGFGLALAAGMSHYESAAQRCSGPAASFQRLAGYILPLAAGLLPAWALITLRVAPIEIFTAPTQLPIETTLANPQNITFGENLHLRNYTVAVNAGHPFTCWLAGRTPCTPVLDITLYWHASAPIPENYVMALQLVSPVPGDNDLRFNYNHWLGRGNLPPTAMPVGALLRDSYRLPLPASDQVVQAWTLQLAFTEPESPNRLPVSVDGARIGDSVALDVLRIPDAQPVPPFTVHTQAYFGDQHITLREALVEPKANAWRVWLLWDTLKAVPTNYTVFVHAYAADGSLLATGDAPPRNGHFPTRLWRPGDSIHDAHTLILPKGVTPAAIAVGLYDPVTGERLPVTPENARVENNAVIIWEVATP